MMARGEGAGGRERGNKGNRVAGVEAEGAGDSWVLHAHAYPRGGVGRDRHAAARLYGLGLNESGKPGVMSAEFREKPWKGRART